MHFRGIAIAGFLAAFMSTVATQLNWGASYLVSDFYRRFVKRDASEEHYVNMSRVSTVMLVACCGRCCGTVDVHQVWMGVRSGTRRRHRHHLSAALVLVAHQCVERNFSHGVRAMFVSLSLTRMALS